MVLVRVPPYVIFTIHIREELARVDLYSTRDVVELLLAAHDNNVAATMRTILTHLGRMPSDPWNPGFNSVRGLYRAYDALMAKIIAGGRHSDQVLVEQKARRKGLQQTIAAVSRGALLQSLAM